MSVTMLTILDEYTRECHVLRVDRALKRSDVLERIGAIAENGSPAYLHLRLQSPLGLLTSQVDKPMQNNRTNNQVSD